MFISCNKYKIIIFWIFVSIYLSFDILYRCRAIPVLCKGSHVTYTLLSLLFQRLIKYNGLKAISDSLRKDSYNISKCGISDLRHFLYKNKSTAQYTSPELEAPYLSPGEQERLFGLYHYLHNRIHSSSRPLKILYHVGQYEALLGWVGSLEGSLPCRPVRGPAGMGG